MRLKMVSLARNHCHCVEPQSRWPPSSLQLRMPSRMSLTTIKASILHKNSIIKVKKVLPNLEQTRTMLTESTTSRFYIHADRVRKFSLTIMRGLQHGYQWVGKWPLTPSENAAVFPLVWRWTNNNNWAYNFAFLYWSLTFLEVWSDLHLYCWGPHHGYRWVGKQPSTPSESIAVIFPFLNVKKNGYNWAYNYES